jgi:hypothetical protein
VPHAQDRHGDRFGILIDAARDSLEFLINADSPSARPPSTRIVLTPIVGCPSTASRSTAGGRALTS